MKMKKVNRVPLVVLVVSASILVITFMAVFLGGCSNSVTNQGPEDSIPFFALIPRTGSVIEAYLNYWDVADGKVVKTDKVVYTIPILPPITSTTDKAIKAQNFYNEDHRYSPVYWDGSSTLILPSFYQPTASVYERTEVWNLVKITGRSTGLGTTLSVFGKDVEMLAVPDEKSGDYRRYLVKLWDGKEYVEKELNLNYTVPGTNYKPLYPLAVANSEDKLYILVCGQFNPETGLDLFLCTVDKATWTLQWKKIDVKKEAGLSVGNPPYTTNTIYFDGSFYLPCSCYCDTAAKVGIGKLTCDRWDVNIPEQFTPKFSEEFSQFISTPLPSVLGSYENYVIFEKRSDLESYIFAIDRVGEIASVMHLTYDDGNVEILNKDGKVLSKASLGQDVSFVFPKPNEE